MVENFTVKAARGKFFSELYMNLATWHVPCDFSLQPLVIKPAWPENARLLYVVMCSTGVYFVGKGDSDDIQRSRARGQTSGPEIGQV
jgi:hypothetical protein